MITQHRFHSNYQPTKMPHQLSGGTFSHAVQKEEGFVLFFFIQREIFFIPTPPSFHRDDSRRGSVRLTICSKDTHKEKKKERLNT